MIKHLFFLTPLFLISLSAHAADTVRIAAIFSKTGEASEYTKEFYWGAQLAAEMITARGGILGKPVTIIELDNKSTAAGCIEAAREAVRLDVTAVCGAAWSSHSIAMAPILQKAGIPMISPASTNPSVTRTGNYIFRTCFTDNFQGEVMAYFARKNLKSKSAATLRDVSSDFSMDLTDIFSSRYESLGSRIMYKGDYLKADTDFKVLLTPVLEKQPDVIFLPGYISDSGLIIKQARNMGITGIFLGTDGWAGGRILYEIAGEAINGIFFTAPWHPSSPYPLGKAYAAAYETRFQDEIFPFAPLIYDVFLILADAAQRAGTLDKALLRDAIAHTSDFEAASGRITFDENGDPVNKDAVVMTFINNRPTFHKTVRVDQEN